VLSAAVPIKAEPDAKPRQGKKSKRSAEQRANRKARKAERMSKKRAARRAAAEESNAEHNPKRFKRAPGKILARPDDDGGGSEAMRVAEPKPVRRGSERAPRSQSGPRERSHRSRIAIGVLLALGLMFGFWLLFKLPTH
jgi:hypothetical protein